MTTTSTPAPPLDQLSPMLLDERKRAPDNEGDYVAEIKYDGYRVLGQFGGGACMLRTRNGADCSTWFAEVRHELAQLHGGHTVVDGEICVLDDIGRSDFDALHSRARRRRWQERDAAVTYCVFDLLVQDGRSVMALPLIERKALLAELLTPAPPHVLYVSHVDASMVARPITWLYEQALALKLEGVVGKLASSAYVPGARTPDWFKFKRPGAVPPKRFIRPLKE